MLMNARHRFIFVIMAHVGTPWAVSVVTVCRDILELTVSPVGY